MAPPKGFRHSKESRLRISETLMGHGVSEDTKDRISSTLMGHSVSSESKIRMSKSHKSDEEIGYSGIHHRLRKLFQGVACIVCGSFENIQAALNHDAPNTRMGTNGFRFSVNLNDYMPLCLNDHRKYDLGKEALRASLDR